MKVRQKDRSQKESDSKANKDLDVRRGVIRVNQKSKLPTQIKSRFLHTEQHTSLNWVKNLLKISTIYIT